MVTKTSSRYQVSPRDDRAVFLCWKYLLSSVISLPTASFMCAKVTYSTESGDFLVDRLESRTIVSRTVYRHLLITWLVVSLLGYGIALNADMHHDLDTDQTHTIVDHAANPDNTDDGSSDDHCCHGIAHLLGLSSSRVHSVQTNNSVLLITYSASLISPPPLSLFRPPIHA